MGQYEIIKDNDLNDLNEEFDNESSNETISTQDVNVNNRQQTANTKRLRKHQYSISYDCVQSKVISEAGRKFAKLKSWLCLPNIQNNERFEIIDSSLQMQFRLSNLKERNLKFDELATYFQGNQEIHNLLAVPDCLIFDQQFEIRPTAASGLTLMSFIEARDEGSCITTLTSAIAPNVDNYNQSQSNYFTKVNDQSINKNRYFSAITSSDISHVETTENDVRPQPTNKRLNKQMNYSQQINVPANDNFGRVRFVPSIADQPLYYSANCPNQMVSIETNAQVTTSVPSDRVCNPNQDKSYICKSSAHNQLYTKQSNNLDKAYVLPNGNYITVNGAELQTISDPVNYSKRQSESEHVINVVNTLYQSNIGYRQQIRELAEKMDFMLDKLHKLQYSMDSFGDHESKIQFYTGLPNMACVKAIYHFTFPPDQIKAHKLSGFEQFMLIMLRLRLNLTTEDLGYRFGIQLAMVTRTFSSGIDHLYVKLQPFIIWSSRQQRILTMPTEFKRSIGPNITVIIDCFEILIEKPSNLLARSKTWSSYKMCNTVKYLIGVSPQGTISFISQGWGGRVSDKYITENCGILDKLSPGDIVLADKGFNISESVAQRGAMAITSTSSRAHRQLPALEIENVRKVAHIRIHVERIIGLVRNKYRMLQGTLPVSFLHGSHGRPLIDKIVTVCCALTNLCPSIIPNN